MGVSCNNGASVKNETTSEAQTATSEPQEQRKRWIQEDDVDRSDDVASKIKGTYKGLGTREHPDTNMDIRITDIVIEKKDNTTAIVSSPHDEFPTFEIHDLVDLMIVINGQYPNSRGAFSYDLKKD